MCIFLKTFLHFVWISARWKERDHLSFLVVWNDLGNLWLIFWHLLLKVFTMFNSETPSLIFFYIFDMCSSETKEKILARAPPPPFLLLCVGLIVLLGFCSLLNLLLSVTKQWFSLPWVASVVLRRDFSCLTWLGHYSPNLFSIRHTHVKVQQSMLAVALVDWVEYFIYWFDLN